MAMMRMTIAIEKGNITVFDSDLIQIRETKLPDYLLDEETNAYHLTEFMRSNLKSLPKNSTIELTKTISGRNFVLKDDDLIGVNDKISCIITTVKSNGIPDNIRTGFSKTDNLDAFVDELFEAFQTKISQRFDKLYDALRRFAVIMKFCDTLATDDTGYEGELSNGIPHGFGTKNVNISDGIYRYRSNYEGNWKNGNFDGYGIYTIYDPENSEEISMKYKGFFDMGKKQGKGELYEPDFGVITGFFSEDRINGFAKIVYKNGDVYEGGLIGKKRNGFGKMTRIDGSFIECEWLDDGPVSENNNVDTITKILGSIFEP